MKPDFLHRESMERKSGHIATPLNCASLSSPLKGRVWCPKKETLCRSELSKERKVERRKRTNA